MVSLVQGDVHRLWREYQIGVPVLPHAVAAMILAADDIEMTEWARGFVQGVRILEASWPTDQFVPEERRMMRASDSGWAPVSVVKCCRLGLGNPLDRVGQSEGLPAG